MITTSVKFTVLTPAGAIAPGAIVSARLTRPDIDAGVVVTQPYVSAQTGTNGQCTLVLWPNSRGVNGSQYEVEVSDGPSVIHTFTITVPESVGVVLAETIISQPPYPTINAAQQALEAAQAAAAEAANASRLTIGTVTTLDPGEDATAEIAGAVGAQTLSLGIPRGADGEGSGGGGATLITVGASPISGHTAVAMDADGLLIYADCTNPAHIGAVLGVVANAYGAGDLAVVQTDFDLAHAGWTFATGPVFVGATGALVQTLPMGAVFAQVVGYALAPTRIRIDVQPPIVLT